MLALQYGLRVNAVLDAFFAAMHVTLPKECLCGWFYHTDSNGIKGRFISLDGGEIILSIPEDFNTGMLPEIQPNWDGRSADEEWEEVAHNTGQKT